MLLALLLAVTAPVAPEAGWRATVAPVVVADRVVVAVRPLGPGAVAVAVTSAAGALELFALPIGGQPVSLGTVKGRVVDGDTMVVEGDEATWVVAADSTLRKVPVTGTTSIACAAAARTCAWIKAAAEDANDQSVFIDDGDGAALLSNMVPFWLASPRIRVSPSGTVVAAGPLVFARPRKQFVVVDRGEIRALTDAAAIQVGPTSAPPPTRAARRPPGVESRACARRSRCNSSTTTGSWFASTARGARRGRPARSSRRCRWSTCAR